MRIIIDITEARTREPPHRKAIRIRTRYYSSSGDCVRIQNAGNLIYGEVRRGLSFDNFDGDLIINHEGEAK